MSLISIITSFYRSKTEIFTKIKSVSWYRFSTQNVHNISALQDVKTATTTTTTTTVIIIIIIIIIKEM